MYRQIKDICTCILLYISITCTNGLLCYSCFGYKENALDCKIITCELSLFDDLRTACYYQVFESGYQRRGCENVTSVLSHSIEGNMTSYYCREDYCNEYSIVSLNDTRRQYKSRETQAPDANIFIIIAIICITVAIIYLFCCIIKSNCQETCDCCLSVINIGECCADLECCGNNSNLNSDVRDNNGSSNHDDYNCCGGNDAGSGDNHDDGGDCGCCCADGNDCDGSDCDCSCFD